MSWSEQSGLVVRDRPAGGPAARAGLQPGDRIVAIDDVPVERMSLKEAVKRLRGEVDSEVELEVERAGKLRVLKVQRAPYKD